MRVVFFGNSPNSLEYLSALREADDVVVAGVVSPVGRAASPVHAAKEQARRAACRAAALIGLSPPRSRPLDALGVLAARAGARWLLPASVNDPEVAEQVAALSPDVVVMAGFTQILKAPLLERLPLVLNVHPSLLPRYRGPQPCFWIIANGEVESGVTVHRVEAGIDSGPILRQERFDLPPWQTAGALQAESHRRGARLLISALADLRQGKERFVPQPGGGSYFGVVTPEHLEVPVHGDAKQAYDRTRAAAPSRGLSLRASTQRLELREAVPFPDYNLGPPGTLASQDGGLVVACAQGSVLFRSWVSAVS